MRRPTPTRACGPLCVLALACSLAFLCACSEPVVVLGDQLADTGLDDNLDASTAPLDAGVIGDGHVHHEEGEDHECREVEPVCGVDNKVYLNRCYAQDAGVAIAKRGPC